MNIKAEQAAAYFDNVACPAITLIYGVEELLNLEALRAARQRAHNDGFQERQRLDTGSSFNWQQLGNEINTPSLFSANRLIELTIDEKKLNKKATDALLALSEHHFNHTRLIIYAPNLEKPERTPWFKQLFKQDHVVVESKTLYPKAFAQQIERRLQQAKLHLTASAHQRLLDYCQGNLLAGQQAIDRLAIHPQHREVITQELLSELLADVSQFGVYALSDAVLAQHWLQAYHIASKLEAEHANQATLLIWLMQRDCSVMLHIKTSLPKEQLPMFKQYRIYGQSQGRYREAAKYFSRGLLINLLHLNAKLDRIAKGAEAGSFWLTLRQYLLLRAQQQS